MNKNISPNIQYIGVDDTDIDLFESQYAVPAGMCYNSYLVSDAKIAVMDTVDARKKDEWLHNLQTALQGKSPDYLVVHHMEPDHSGCIGAFMAAYPQAKLVTSAKAVQFIAQFIENPDFIDRCQVVKEGDTLSLGTHSLQFIAAPMVHWPEVLVSYDAAAKTLFSADGFGKFGTYDADADDWACEARRYYFNICGKYGQAVSALLKKAAALDIQTICPLHGPVLQGSLLAEALRLYTVWSTYEVETKGVLVAYASIHGGTKAAAEYLAAQLRQKGCPKVAVTDLSRDDQAEAIEDAFRMDTMVLAAPTYDGDLFPPMYDFIHHLQLKAYQNRRVALIENGTWAPQAARIMKSMLEGLKNIEIIEPVVSIKSRMNSSDEAAIAALADALL
ncbi:MAG: FprA family A-type flavoprotein [Paludibacteraceae bacterium]|nr:FprA family A-type flavoprotein [Paludibacteraceae bacterium]